MRALFRQFSFPGGIPSHVAPETPGSIHEGGELGYALVHAYGAVFDNPDLLALCVVGDGEAETGPLAASWHSNKFLDPAPRRRRAAGAAPQRLQDRQPDRAGPHPGRRARVADARLRPHAALRRRRRARRPCTRSSPPPSTRVAGRHRRDQGRPGRPTRRRLADDRAAHARRAGPGRRRSTGCRSRAPSAPTRCRSPAPAPTPGTGPSSRSGCAATGPRSCSTTTGRLVPELRALAPDGDRRMSANPHANGGRLLRDLAHAGLPRLRRAGRAAGRRRVERGDRGARRVPARRHAPATPTASGSWARTRSRPTGCRRCSR